MAKRKPLSNRNSDRCKWAAQIISGIDRDRNLQVHDYFHNMDQPIHVKEAEAVLRAIVAFDLELKDSRVDILTNNQALLAAWRGQGSKSLQLNSILKSIFQHTLPFNIDL